METFFNQRADDEGLFAPLDSFSDPGIGGGSFVGRHDPGLDSYPSRRHFIDVREVEIPVEGQGNGSWYRRRSHSEGMGSFASLDELCSLLHPKSMLFVDYYQRLI